MIEYKRLLEAGGIIVLEEFLTASVFNYDPVVLVDLVISRLLMNFNHQLARILYFSTGILYFSGLQTLVCISINGGT